jgi:hypothetical protein
VVKSQGLGTAYNEVRVPLTGCTDWGSRHGDGPVPRCRTEREGGWMLHVDPDGAVVIDGRALTADEARSLADLLHRAADAAEEPSEPEAYDWPEQECARAGCDNVLPLWKRKGTKTCGGACRTAAWRTRGQGGQHDRREGTARQSA